MRCASIAVGIVDYADNAYSRNEMRLRYAVGDAEAFHRYVSLCWPADIPQHHLLRDRDGSITNLETAVASVKNYGYVDLFFLYLSGHGEVARDGSGWFCLSDAQPEQPSLSGVDIDRLLGAVNADSVVVFIDCCHAEAVVTRCRSFDIHEDRRVRVVAASCRAPQRAWEDDDLRRSIFSDILLRALSTDSPLANAQGNVDVQAQLFPYLRDQVPIAASAAKRGHEQEPVMAGFLAGPLTLPVISSTSLGRPLTISQAIKAGVRRFLVAGIVAAAVLLSIFDLMIFHLAVDSGGKVVVRPGFYATYGFMPFHFVGNLDSGLSIRDVKPSDDRFLSELAQGSLRGIATHRDQHGLKPWFAMLQPGVVSATLEPLRAFAFGEMPKLDVNNDRPPLTETLFLARLRNLSPSDVAPTVYPYDPKLPWTCKENVSNRLDFTRLLADREVFGRDLQWTAATAVTEPKARGQRLEDIVKIAAYRALNETDGEKRLAEFEDFAMAIEKIAVNPTNEFQAAVGPFFSSAKGTWCSLHASFAAAIAGNVQDNLTGEADLRAIFERYDRSKEGDLGGSEQRIAVAGLARLARHRPLAPATLKAILAMIKRDDADITAKTPATTLLTEIATSQDLGSDLTTLLITNLRPETGPADFAPVTAINLLARNFAFLGDAEKEKLRQWLSAAAPSNPFVSDLHEAIGFVALRERISSEQQAILVARLSSTSRFPPQAINYRGEMIIAASGDMAAVALGRVAQSTDLTADIAERLANLAAARTDIDGRREIVLGLANQWFGKSVNIVENARRRLADASADSGRRTLEIEVAAAATTALQVTERNRILEQLAAVWQHEIEPTQRIALATLMSTILLD